MTASGPPRPTPTGSAVGGACLRENPRRRIGHGYVLLFALASLTIGLTGCSSPPAWERAGAQPLAVEDPQAWEALAQPPAAQRWTGGVSAAGVDRPELPAAGLQLPRVSPDGRHVAFLDADRDGERVHPDAWITGRGLEGVSLWVRGVGDGGIARNIAVDHAAWPTWSPDSRRVFFISHDPASGPALGIHDLSSGRTDRLAVGLRQMFGLAVSPSGRSVAVSGYGQIADQAVIFVIDLETGRAESGPVATLGGAQLSPRWLDERTLLYCELDANGGGLLRWTRGGEPRPIMPLELPTSVFDAIHLHAGVPEPSSPDGKWFCYYAAGRDRLAWVELSTKRTVWSPPGTRAGHWWADRWALAADQQRLTLLDLSRIDDAEEPATGPAAAESPEPADDPPQMTLLPGRWVPLWADTRSASMLLLGPAEAADRFRLLQLWMRTHD